MGGKAFNAPQGGKPALANFPRMPPPLYTALREQIRRVLSHHFSTITFPAEAPEKPDHGDLDVLVHSASGCNPGLERITEILGAIQSRAYTFAVPMTAPCFAGIDLNVYGPNFSDALVQVDLRICKDLEELHWRAFKNGYGDLWQILGVLIRPLGLTVDESHLCVRIQEVEDGSGSKEDTKVRLCDEPDEVLNFLGLDLEEYHRGFETEMQVFEWCARCRFFSTTSLFKHVDARVDEGRELEVQPESANINHNDRQRFRKRMMFVRFREWVHSNLTTLSAHNTTLTRRDVFDAAISRYNKQAQVDTVLTKHRRIIREKNLKSRVAALMRQNVLEQPAVLAGVSEGDVVEVREKKITDAVSRLLRGFKLFLVLDAEGRFSIARPSAAEHSANDHSNEDHGTPNGGAETAARAPSQNWADSTLGEDEFVEWVTQHWREIDALEIERRTIGQQSKMRRKKVVEAREDGAEAERRN